MFQTIYLLSNKRLLLVLLPLLVSSYKMNGSKGVPFNSVSPTGKGPGFVVFGMVEDQITSAVS